MRKGGLHTLNNFQRLGNIQWSRPLLKFSIRDFEQLSVILKKIIDQNSNRQLTEAIRQIWQNIQYKSSRYNILIMVSLGKHEYYLQSLVPQKYYGKMYGYTFLFHQKRYKILILKH